MQALSSHSGFSSTDNSPARNASLPLIERGACDARPPGEAATHARAGHGPPLFAPSPGSCGIKEIPIKDIVCST